MVDTRRHQGPASTSHFNSDDNVSISETNLKRTGSLKRVDKMTAADWCCVLCTSGVARSLVMARHLLCLTIALTTLVLRA